MSDQATQQIDLEKDRAAPGASWGFVRRHMREYGILVALVVIMAFFQIMTDGILLKPINLTNLVLQNSYIIIMALGMLLVIVSGNIDLSVGSILGFGYAPYTGGTISYIDGMGTKAFAALCEKLAAKHGERFEPTPLLREMAKTGETFYGRFPPEGSKAEAA